MKRIRGKKYLKEGLLIDQQKFTLDLSSWRSAN